MSGGQALHGDHLQTEIDRQTDRQTHSLALHAPLFSQELFILAQGLDIEGYKSMKREAMVDEIMTVLSAYTYVPGSSAKQ